MADPSPRPAPHPVFALSDRFVDDLAALSPMTASALGVPGGDDRWDDTSPHGYQAQAELYRRYQRELAELPVPGDGEASAGEGGEGEAGQWDRLAVRVLGELLELSLDPIEHGDHLHELGHIQSLVPELRSTFELMGTSSAEEWTNVAARLERLGQPLSGLRASLTEGRRRGLVAAQRQVRSIISQLRAGTAAGGALAQLVDSFDGSEAMGGTAMAERLADALTAAATASEGLARWLEDDYLPTATEVDGVGAERYQRAARAFLGTDLDLAETYRWGWDHLLDIRSQMNTLAAQIDADATLVEVVHRLATADVGAGAVAGQDEFRDQMLQRIRQAIDDLDGSHFQIPAEIKSCDVRMAPAGAPLGAWFVPPSEDFSRPGTTWWSMGDRAPVPVWDQVTTAYHEGFPGHHLQCGLQVYLREHLSRAHRLLFWLPGYGEGWALYAERLMRELGYFEKPEYELGLLAGNALRAARVAIDIGSHLDLPIPDDVTLDGAPFHAGERWTFETGVECLERFAFQPHDLAVSEITRYLGWPGQAIAYKVGERAILALRDEVQARDGDRFDLKAFHADVLGHGPVGLDHLRELVIGTGGPAS